MGAMRVRDNEGSEIWEVGLGVMERNEEGWGAMIPEGCGIMDDLETCQALTA